MSRQSVSPSERLARSMAIAIVVATGLLIAGTCILRLSNRGTRHIEPDRTVYPLRGADLSAHNGDIDFDSLATVLDFVYLKASEGRTFVDRNFRRNHAEARRVGIPVGAYHFFRFGAPGVEQSDNLRAVLDSLTIDLPVAIDVEESGNKNDISTDTVVKHLREMVDDLRTHGHRVIIYTNKDGYARFVYRNFEDTELWICSFTDPPMALGGRWTLWQHSHSEHLPGVRGSVDLNTFNGSATEFAAYLQ